MPYPLKHNLKTLLIIIGLLCLVLKVGAYATLIMQILLSTSDVMCWRCRHAIPGPAGALGLNVSKAPCLLLIIVIKLMKEVASAPHR